MENLIGLDEEKLKSSFMELVRRTSSVLPDDVIAKIKEYQVKEKAGTRAASALDTIMENIKLAEDGSRPICQDTGTVIFDVYHPLGVRQSTLEMLIKSAVAEATANHYLRPNVVDPLTGMSKFDNNGIGHPAIYLKQWDEDYLKVALVLKGGGCENVGTQYSLPNTGLKAGRDLDGIKKVCLDAVVKAQGKGCAPGVLGIGIGGDRAQGYTLSKKQLHRKLDDKNENPDLAELEEWLLEKANTLGIGPMGFGGSTTLLGVKAALMDRIPASYYVSVTYMCWAYRRRFMTVKNGNVEFD
ncbi:Fumarate hydratase class I, alpha region; L(+)-tartrate dehydratase alpha subunit [hydrothermal vent metagenome]|uniref:Fumarate hydratase class I, alpha region L(+)-tartrate dehydratase alpha subunit n=1 Tax=hydrothermal vent metagenome TaxID=652676 RepID=A0A3B1CCE8_9ZZZZ